MASKCVTFPESPNNTGPNFFWHIVIYKRVLNKAHYDKTTKMTHHPAKTQVGLGPRL